jgi:hypothetical protein
VILIEFGHQRPANLRHLAKDPEPAEPGAHPHRRPHPQRERLRQGPAAPALRSAPAPARPLTSPPTSTRPAAPRAGGGARPPCCRPVPRPP